MDAQELIRLLAGHGIVFSCESGKLVSKSRPGALTDELSGLVRRYLPEIKNFVFSRPPQTPISARPASCDVPLSFAQERMWFLSQLDVSSPVYNEVKVLKLTGSLDLGSLEESLAFIVGKHHVLRTCYREVEGKVVCFLIDDGPFEIARPFRALVSAIDFHLSTPFVLSQDYPIRVELVEEGPEQHYLVLCFHHIAIDGWSYGVMLEELLSSYRHSKSGGVAPSKVLPIQYADYAYWQREWLQGEVLDAQLGYWRDQLSGLPVLHSLPLDRPRPPQQSFDGRALSTVLEPALAGQLRSLCQAQGATLFMGLHAVFSVLLARYSNEQDIVVGSPIANREQAEIGGLIGFFVNTLVLRSDLTGDPSFVEVMQRSKRMLLDAYAHQQVPFEQVVEALQPERSLSHSPLFQVMLVLQNNPSGTLELPGLRLYLERIQSNTSKFDLTLTAVEDGGGLSLEWEYNTDLFEDASIERMAGQFGVLLDSLLSKPERSVYEAELLDAASRRLLLEEWNATECEYARDACLHELFEAQAGRTPDAVALVFEDQQLSYGELNARANRLAHYLVSERGVGPDTLVGVCLERSLDMVVALLGILKAGGAYVPLLPSLPQNRLTAIVTGMGPCNVITHRAHAPIFTGLAHVNLLKLDTDKPEAGWLDYSEADVSVPSLTSSHLAYVLHTSGSTGHPKGIAMPHEPLVNLIGAIKRQAPILEGPHTILQYASLGFDMSFTDIFLAFLGGGRLVLIDEMTQQDVVRLVACVQDSAISVVNLPSAMLRVLCEHCVRLKIMLPNLKAIISTAELLKVTDSMREFFAHHSGCQLINHYGPTETHVVTAMSLDLPTSKWPSIPSIGEAISNVFCYVVDKRLQLVPIGVVGELCIAGAGLARGYLNRDDLTVERFVVNPYDRSGSATRLYRTGDHVRWRTDGQLEYVGRADSQVKLRGFRIELNEIEHALCRNSSVREALVLLHDHQGDPKLVAYVIGKAAAEAELRKHLAKELPEYMNPSLFVWLDAFPLTQNGKIDRRRLPAPQMQVLSDGYVAPQTEIERRLCSIWQDVLGIERVGVADNFFRLGGHSLLAAQMLSRVNAFFGTELSLRIALMNPDISGLASFISALELSVDVSLDVDANAACLGRETGFI